MLPGTSQCVVKGRIRTSAGLLPEETLQWHQWRGAREWHGPRGALFAIWPLGGMGGKRRRATSSRVPLTVRRGCLLGGQRDQSIGKVGLRHGGERQAPGFVPRRGKRARGGGWWYLGRDGPCGDDGGGNGRVHPAMLRGCAFENLQGHTTERVGGGVKQDRANQRGKEKRERKKTT